MEIKKKKRIEQKPEGSEEVTKYMRRSLKI
jgi:hypothetical protein